MQKTSRIAKKYKKQELGKTKRRKKSENRMYQKTEKSRKTDYIRTTKQNEQILERRENRNYQKLERQKARKNIMTEGGKFVGPKIKRSEGKKRASQKDQKAEKPVASMNKTWKLPEGRKETRQTFQKVE